MIELPLPWTDLFVWFSVVVAVSFGIYIGALIWNRYLRFDKYYKPFYTMDDVDDR